jgi:hypothetical protein
MGIEFEYRPTELALDAINHRLFSACSGRLIVLNADTGAIVAVLPIGAGTDGVDYDMTAACTVSIRLMQSAA